MKQKKLLILTSLLILLPVIAGVVLWNRLPDRVPTHFNFAGEPDGWSGKAFAVFALPLFLVVIHLVCAFAVTLDPKRRNVGNKIYSLVLWICPVVSLLTGGMVYAKALNAPVDVTSVMLVYTGVLFAVVGNYLPKCRQNYTVGIKIPWTLADEDNWNRTHRFAGPLWVAGGVVLMVTGVLGWARLWLVLGVTVLLVLIPVGYSLLLYRRKQSAP